MTPKTYRPPHVPFKENEHQKTDIAFRKMDILRQTGGFAVNLLQSIGAARPRRPTSDRDKNPEKNGLLRSAIHDLRSLFSASLCDLNQRACVEQHIEELKNDLQVDGFCMRDFFATECAFLRVCFTYNLLSLYQHAAAPERRKSGFQRPATLRSAVFIGGAILGKRSRKPVIYIAQSWGGLDKHKPLIDNILSWQISTSPKLPPEPPGQDTNGTSNDEKTRAA
jgi:hypothetical protein